MRDTTWHKSSSAPSSGETVMQLLLLFWRPHIQKVITKISQTIGILGRARSLMNETQLSLLYSTMILPHLRYCILNWGNFKVDFNVGLGNKILKLQKCLVRLISNTHRISHADPLFHTRGILKIEHLYEQSLRLFSYKLSKNKLPREVSSLFRKIEHSHNTRCAKNNLSVTRANKHSSRSVAPACWNSLSLSWHKAIPLNCLVQS